MHDIVTARPPTSSKSTSLGQPGAGFLHLNESSSTLGLICPETDPGGKLLLAKTLS
jgi:hypothetical protein